MLGNLMTVVLGWEEVLVKQNRDQLSQVPERESGMDGNARPWPQYERVLSVVTQMARAVEAPF